MSKEIMEEIMTLFNKEKVTGAQGIAVLGSLLLTACAKCECSQEDVVTYLDNLKEMYKNR